MILRKISFPLKNLPNYRFFLNLSILVNSQLKGTDRNIREKQFKSMMHWFLLLKWSCNLHDLN